MKILITLDYELFMGKKTGSVESCLLSPMNSFISMLDRYGIKATIFVDAAYLLRLSELKDKHDKLKSDFELISDHLKCLEQDGHDIQLHFHPQWIYSDYDSKQWIMDFEHYKLSDLPENVLRTSFYSARLLLEEIIGKKIIAFRAGGYSLPTYSGYIDLFKLNGIKIDSSVLRGAYVDSKYQKYDYRNIPKASIY
ncbi:polysaccharide deacetylase family protein, partial [Bacteroides salyersiae]